jgi:peptide/nickel transport system substrate-binding protein
MGFLYCNEIFSDVRFKQAMSLAINRDEINETVFLGLAKPQQFTPADPLFVSFVTPEQSFFMTEYDIDKANALLDEMGLEKGADGYRLRPDGKHLIVNMNYTVLGGAALTHELVSQYWEAVGVKTNLKEVSTEAFRTENLNNNQDVFIWRTDGTAAPSLIANSLMAFVPFQASGLQVKTGIPWGKYWDSNGAEGQEPPAWAGILREKAVAIGALEPYSDAWNAAGTELVQLWNDQLITIGTVGNVPVPLIVSNRIGNTPPSFTSQIWDFYCLFPFRVDQEFIKD